MSWVRAACECGRVAGLLATMSPNSPGRKLKWYRSHRSRNMAGYWNGPISLYHFTDQSMNTTPSPPSEISGCKGFFGRWTQSACFDGIDWIIGIVTASPYRGCEKPVMDLYILQIVNVSLWIHGSLFVRPAHCCTGMTEYSLWGRNYST